MKRLIFFATLFIGSFLNIMALSLGGDHEHVFADYSECNLIDYYDRTFETNLDVSGYADFVYTDEGLLVTFHNILEWAYEPFTYVGSVMYLQHDDYLHIQLFTDPVDGGDDIISTDHRCSFSFIIPDVKVGEYNITIDVGMGRIYNPVVATVVIEESMDFRKSLDIRNAERILPSDHEWLLCSMAPASPRYLLRTSDNGTEINGHAYLDVMYCEGTEWDVSKAGTLAYARAFNDALYVVAAPGEFPKSMWHASLEGTLDIRSRQDGETLAYDFTPRFDRRLFVYDPLHERMETISPLSSRWMYEPDVYPMEFPTELTLDALGRQRWITGVGAEGGVMGPFVYPVYSIGELSPSGCMRVACVKDLSGDRVVYEDDGLMSANGMYGIVSAPLSDRLVRLVGTVLSTDLEEVSVEIASPDATAVWSGILRRGMCLDLQTLASGVLIVRATDGGSAQTVKTVI